MVIDASPLSVLATAASALLGLALTVLFDVWWDRPSVRSVVVGLGASASGWAVWLAVAAIIRPAIDDRLTLLLAALAGLAAVLAMAPIRFAGYRTLAALSFAIAWTAAVFTPVAVALFSLSDGLLGAGLKTLDLAGALPVLVAAGCAGLAVLLIERRALVGASRSPRWWLIGGVFAIVWLLWLIWLTGLELAIDELTGRIITNGLIAPIASAAAWLIVQRIRQAATTPVAAVAGLFCGLVAITAGCGYLNPVGAVLTGVIAGAVCALVGYSLIRRTGQPAWMLATVLVVGASIGVVLLGIFATRSGLIFTGQPEVLFSQFTSAVIVAGYAALVSIVVWLPLRAVIRRTRSGGRARRF